MGNPFNVHVSFQPVMETKMKKSTVVMELPADQEIEAVEESRTANPSLIKKTIRYRNGLVATLYQDFHESVFSVQLESVNPLWVSRNQILKMA
jgi:hypothetical protein